ncbi:MAG: hypothetical protein ACOC1H_02035 [Desulfosalsimonas sp.]
MDTTPQVFKNRSAAAKWLWDNGYGVRKSKVYQDVEKGLLRMEPDGTITIESVRRYIDHPEAGISEHLETIQAAEDFDNKEYNRRTAIAKMEKAELEAKKLRFEIEKEEGKWLPRADFEMEMAARAAILEQGFRNLVRIRADDWIHIAGGDVHRAAEVKTAINTELDRLMNEFANTDTFQVIFEDDDYGDR